jgi:site-specific recombinase XerC
VALRGFHEWRGEFLKFKVKIPKKAPKLIPEEPILKMLELSAVKPHDELILRLMTDAGMRRDETVNVAVGAAEDGWLRFVGKGNKERQVPMTKRLANLVALFTAGKSPDTSLVGVGEKGIYGLVKRYAATAGHPELAPHDLRRYFGMRIQELSGDIRVTQELLGHSNVNTTQIYTAVKPKRREDAIARLGGEQPAAPATHYLGSADHPA